MAVLKTALVLVHVVWSVLAWENLPSIPANRRAQYYLQHDDGGYKYGYDTGEGHSGRASADGANQVQGEYSYVDGSGQRVNWQYTAGEGGYVPTMGGSAAAGRAVAKVSGFSSRAHSAPAAPEDPDYDENADASYSFNVDTDSYKRSESSDNRGNIQGQYSYNSPVGGNQAISYIAGEGTGFVVTSDSSSAAAGSAHGPASGYSYPAPGAAHSAAAYDGQTQVNPDGSFAFSYNTGDHSHQAVADGQNNVRGSYSYVSHDDGKTRKIDYQAGSATGYVASGAHLPVAPSGASANVAGGGYSAPAPVSVIANRRTSEPSNAQTNVNPDGSFSYSYTTGDHSHQAAADAKNNVRGSYSFKAKDDGKTRRVDYIAGADTGFVATGDHLPGNAGFKSATSQASTSTHGSNSFSSASASASSSSSSTTGGQTDGSYSFSYQTGDHAHQANADSQGNVAGSFSFVAKDGVSRTVDYTAGAEQGFIAKGAHLPVAPAPGAGAPAAPVSTYSGNAAPGGGYHYSAPSSGASFSHDASSDVNNDGSYSYNYDAGTSSKQETADAQGNVMGSFSYIGGDGVNRHLTYTARGEEGFLAHGDHLPAAPAAAPGHEVGLASPNAFAHADLFSGSKSAHDAASTGSVMASKDGAYSYSYKTGGQASNAASFKSTAGSQNNFNAASQNKFNAATKSHLGSGVTGHVMASKDGAYAYSYKTGGHDAASSKATAGHGSSATPYSSSASSAAVTGHVKASKDGAYAYSYNTGGQSSSASSGHASAAKTYSAASNAASSDLSTGSQAQDGSYSFSYDAGTHSHQQSADANNNVKGSFSFKAKDDGKVRKVEYVSGSATGFVAKGAHLPVAPAGSGAGVAASPISAYSGAGSSHDASSGINSDGSYSYSYDAGTSSKQESADAQGNVMGSFSFVGGDGVNRQLSYTANKDDGFKAAGAHLPVAPTVGGASSSASHFKSASSSAYSSSSSSSSADSASHRFSSNIPASTSLLSRSDDGKAIISRYLPPESPHKFGYIYDTKA